MAEIITNSPQETQEFAGKFVNDLAKAGKKRNGALIIALEGEMGSGKTTFAQGLARGLGVKESITSPTFVLIKKYGIPHPPPATLSRARRRAGNPLLGKERERERFKNLYHIDCYRLEKPWQLQELGFGEIINNPENIIAIEWAENIAEILPEDKTTINFEFINENKRKIIFSQKFSPPSFQTASL